MFYQFEDHWKWGDADDKDGPDIQDNTYFPWTLEVIRKHADKMDWDKISQDTELLLKYPQLFDEFRDHLRWFYISGNEKLDWTEELIEKLEDKWEWEYLSGNRAINWTSGLIRKYHDKIDMDRVISGNYEQWLNIVRPKTNSYPPVLEIPGNAKYTNEELELVLKEGGWFWICSDDRIPWTEELISQNMHNIEWDALSRNRSLPWTFEMIDHYKDYWDFTELSNNEGLPWSEDLLFAFMDRWEWGRLVPEDTETIIVPGLSGNIGLPWSSSFINKYKDRWNRNILSHNEGIPWSLKIINEFHDIWEWRSLRWNRMLWETIFYPHLNEQVIDELMTEIINKKLV